ncbi:MAG: hypothetical protein HUJ76_09155, partial [Parasporobacterium sp.]|nr:hypothetical protein [Parasporobacterium sp.]
MRKIAVLISALVLCVSLPGHVYAGEINAGDYGCAVQAGEFQDTPVNLIMGSQTVEGAAIQHAEGSVIQNSGSARLTVRDSFIKG